MKKAILLIAALLAGCTSLEKQQSHERAQVEIVKVQREQIARQASDQAAAQAALYESLARIAAASPETADAAVLAIALVGQGASGDQVASTVIPLQAQRNEAIELTKAIAPTLGGVITNVGLAALNASVSKESIRQQSAVQINDRNNDAQIVSAVAGLGRAAVENSGADFTMYGDASVNTGSQQTYTDSYNTSSSTWSESSQDTTNTSSQDTTTTTETTYDTSDDGFMVMGAYNYQTGKVEDSTVTYKDQQTTLSGVLEYLQGLGSPYTLTVDGEVLATSSEGEGEPVEVDCSTPQFSPANPACT